MHALFKKITELSSQEVTLQKQFQSMMKMAGGKICQTSMKAEWVMLVQALFQGERKYMFAVLDVYVYNKISLSSS